MSCTQLVQEMYPFDEDKVASIMAARAERDPSHAYHSWSKSRI